MGLSLKIIIYLITVSVSLLFVTGDQKGPAGDTCDTSVTQRGYRGGSITINCSYPETAENTIRSFCREDTNFNCTNLIETYKANQTKRDEFSLTDDKQQRVFTVTIARLTQEDNGTYQCVLKRPEDASPECLRKINLGVMNWDDIPPTQKTYESGSMVYFDCPYPAIHETNEKFLCKGENRLNCEKLIRTIGWDRRVYEGRFAISDNQRKKIFYVTIKSVNQADSGTYWCGSDRSLAPTNGTRILIKSERRTQTKSASPITPHSNDNNDDDDDVSGGGGGGGPPTGLIAGVTAGLAAVVILVVVFLLVRHKFPGVQACCAARGSSEQRTNTQQNTEGNHGDHDYEEIQMQNQQADSGNPPSTVYATVNPPQDQLHYASVNFQNDSASVPTDGNTLPDTNENDSAAEKTLYSTVTEVGGL